MAEPTGPAHLALLAAVARRYYLDDRSKVEIAAEMKISRFKVARLLEQARAIGLVRIEIGHAGSVDADLSGRLRTAYGLRYAVVVDVADDDPALLRAQVGQAAAELLTEVVRPGEVLGLAWARSLLEMARCLERLPTCAVVQLTGVLTRPDVDSSSIDLVRDVARVAHGPAYFFYAPMILPDATTAAVLKQQPEVAQAMGRIPDVTTAVLGLGSWDPPYSTVWDAITPAERQTLLEAGVVADLSGILLDDEGRPIDAPLSQRMIGVGADQLRRVRDVVALAYDASKARAVRAAVCGGFVTSLVTHTSLAEALLDLAADGAAGVTVAR